MVVKHRLQFSTVATYIEIDDENITVHGPSPDCIDTLTHSTHTLRHTNAALFFVTLCTSQYGLTDTVCYVPVCPR